MPPRDATDTTLLLGAPAAPPAGGKAASWVSFLTSPKFLVMLSVIVFPAAVFGALAARAAAPPPPPLAPSQLAVLLGGDPNTQVTISFAVGGATAAAAEAAGAVRWGLAPAASADALPFSAPAACVAYSTTPAQTGGSAAYASPALCAASFSVPASPSGAPVYYAVGASGAVRATATAPPPGAPARIAVMGDVGTTADSAATLARIAASHAAAPFAAGLLVGDVSYADGNQSVWDDWGALSAPLAAALPVYTLVGNRAFGRDARPAQRSRSPAPPHPRPPPHPRFTAQTSGLTPRLQTATTRSRPTATTPFPRTSRAAAGCPWRAAATPPRSPPLPTSTTAWTLGCCTWWRCRATART